MANIGRAERLLLPDIETTPYILRGGALNVDACPDCWEVRAHYERYAFACKVLHDTSVLDFGCGVGYGADMLVAAGNAVMAWDAEIHTRMIARILRPHLNVPAVLRMNECSFGGCVAFEVIEHMDSPTAFIASVPARHIVASVPVKPTVGVNPWHKHDFTIDSFRSLLETRFDIKSWWTQTLPYCHEPAIVIMHGETR